ncbi:MAG: CpsD/CapB family tyrosine-protein kinase [Solobacterium sp.]|nr:CpsD/CapB family tyrosine-protein kinase [Solobacterium sp.]
MPKSKIVRQLNIIDEKSSFAYVEAYKTLRANIQYVHNNNSGRGNVLMITSSIPGEGKSNVSINLAYTLAQDGKRVVLVDCDLRKGTLHRYLDIPALTPGLSSMIENPDDNSIKVLRIQKYGFCFIPCGALPENPSEMIGSSSMSKVLSKLSASFDYVICDTAPVNAVADTSILCRYVDGVILVVSHNEVTRNTVLLAKETLENVNANVLGVVLNKYDAKDAGEDYGYYSYYNYHYYGGEGYGEETKSE